MDPSQSFHVCSLPAEKAKGSLPGKETGRKIKEFGELDLKCELKAKIKLDTFQFLKQKQPSAEAVWLGLFCLTCYTLSLLYYFEHME